MKNTKYAKVHVDPSTSRQWLEYAPSSLSIPGKGMIGNPSREDYLKARWKEVIRNRPPEKPGFHIVETGYDETETTIETKYKYEEDPVVYRHWTPLSVKRTVDAHAVNEAGQEVTLWTLLREMLIKMNYLEDFWGSQYIAEDDPAYLTAYQMACEKFGKEMIDEVINEIPTENV